MKLIVSVLAALALLAAAAWFGGFLSPEPMPQTATETATETADSVNAAAEPADADAAPEAEPVVSPTPEQDPEPEQPAVAAEASEPEEAGEAEPANAEALEADTVGGATRVIGWLHGDCMLVEQNDLEAGTNITVIVLEDPQAVVGGEITGKAEGDDACALLDAGRRAVNEDQGSFYTVKTPQILEFAIGVVHPDGAGSGPDPAMMDADESGVPDQFAYCTTAEGLRFGVWDGEPYYSKELWRGTYLLERDTMPTCPS